MDDVADVEEEGTSLKLEITSYDVLTPAGNLLDDSTNDSPRPYVYERNELLDIKTKQVCHTMTDEKAFSFSCPKQISLDYETVARPCPNRRVYTRTQMLELKNLEKYQADYYRKKTFLIHRFIPKFYKLDYEISQKQSKAGDNSALVLGPQNGSWNTGCHAAKPKRSSNETLAAGKNAKASSTKPYARKSDFKTGERKDARFTRNQSGKSLTSLTRGKLKSDSNFTNRDSNASRQGEPQWFSEGPTTINDTIELGGNIDEELNPSKSPPSKREENCIEKKIEKVSSSEKNIDINFNIPNDVGASKASIVSTGKSRNSALDFVDHSAKHNTEALPFTKPPTDVCGSRFRHLFANSQSTLPAVTSNDTTSKLLKLLSSSYEISSLSSQSDPKISPSLVPGQYSASDLEAALRSLLLVNKTEIVDATSKTIPSRSFTLQEIEAAEWLQPFTDKKVSIRPVFPHSYSGDGRQANAAPSNLLPPSCPPMGFVPISQSFGALKVSPPESAVNRDSLLRSSFPDGNERFRFTSNLSPGLMKPTTFPTQQNSVDSFFEKMHRDSAALSDFSSTPRVLPSDISSIRTCSDVPRIDSELQYFRRPIVKGLQTTNEAFASPSSLLGRQVLHDFDKSCSIPSATERPPLSVSQQNFRDLQSIIHWNRKYNQNQSESPDTASIAPISLFEPSHIPFNAGNHHPSAFSFPPSILRSGSSTTTNVLPSGQCASILPESLPFKPASAYLKQNLYPPTNSFSLQKLWQDQ